MFESFFEKYPFFRKVPAILCMAIIFKLSSLTMVELDKFIHIWDKLSHCVEYSTLAGCFALWFSRKEWSCSKKSCFLKILFVTILTLIYGVTDEFHQSFVEGRNSSILDVVADTIGGIIGASVYYLIVIILNKYDPIKNPKE